MTEEKAIDVKGKGGNELKCGSKGKVGDIMWNMERKREDQCALKGKLRNV